MKRSSFIMLTISILLYKTLQKTFPFWHSRTQNPSLKSVFFYFESGFSKIKSEFSVKDESGFFPSPGSGFPRGLYVVWNT
jgi:hypothetical protein